MQKYGVYFSMFVALSIICGSSDGHAQNFFEVLFGGFQPQGRANSAAQSTRLRRMKSARDHRRPKVKFAANHPAPLNYAEAPRPPFRHDCCSSAQEAIDKALTDTTLRPGDAFMSKDGLQVFVGGSADSQRFVAVQQAKIDKKLRARLAAVEQTPIAAHAAYPTPGKRMNVAARQGLPRPTPTKERLITTSEGKTIRLVGGYAN